MQSRALDPSFPAAASAPHLHERFCGSFEYTSGALPRVDGTVRFRLWAPNVERVALELEAQPPKMMEPCAAGYHQIVVPCLPGARYRYRIAPNMAVPDPASRLQSGGVHGASVVLSTGNYPWRHNDWRGRPWTETVLYEIHCGLTGGFRGVEHRLPELAKLGITAVELMPIAQFPGPRNWGYDGVMPYAPDCTYGTPADLKRLVDTAHGLGIMMFLDVVYNHFGPDGNYLSSYAADFFRADVNTPWGPAIDFRQAPVRDFFKE
ncbi:MAG: alpha-amylase family glycosyl hydrolase, partial [Burkholderiaceae bacterium]